MKVKIFSKLILLGVFFVSNFCASKYEKNNKLDLDLGEDPIISSKESKGSFESDRSSEKNTKNRNQQENAYIYCINMQEVGQNSSKLGSRQAEKQKEYQIKSEELQKEGVEFEKAVQAFQKDMQSGLKSKEALKSQEQVLMEKQQALMMKQQQMQASLQQDMMQIMQEIKDDVNDYIKSVSEKNPNIIILQSDLYINPSFDRTQEAIQFINKKYSDSQKIKNNKSSKKEDK
jgi:Skp family chaperone for outer membrane proteins